MISDPKLLRPMLAVSTSKLDEKYPLRWPKIASPKIDGIRGIVHDGRVLSRALKMIPNGFIQDHFGVPQLAGLDGEFTVGEPNTPTTYRDTVSGLMSQDGDPDIHFWVFDTIYHSGRTYRERAGVPLWQQITKSGISNVHLLQSEWVTNEAEAATLESHWLNVGYEGIMYRDPDGLYKNGRSTPREQGLVKKKMFVDSEALLISMEPLYTNTNVAELDERGYTKRSSHQENQVQQELLGALVVRDVITGQEFRIGTGFTLEDRKLIWQNRSNPPSSIVKYKFFPVGVKDLPRHPVFAGWRMKEDY